MAARNWKEESDGAAITPDKVTLNFSSPEQTATLKLEHRYDLTVVSLVTQVKESALAARAKAKKDADDKFFAGREDDGQADDGRGRGQAERTGRQASRTRRCMRSPARPRPCRCRKAPKISSSMAAEGKLEFESSSSVKALASLLSRQP